MTSSVEKIRMRRARHEDSDLMFEWRNHPDTRRYSFDLLPIDPELHKTWFSASLTNPSRFLLIGEDINKSALGVVRFDQKGDSSEISIYLVPQRRGQGLGILLLEAAIGWLKDNSTVKYIYAEVLAENEASLKMFALAGFRPNKHRLSLCILR